MKYSIVVAYDLCRGIGRNNTIPWKLPLDMKRFKEITSSISSNCVIMGRKTWDSIPSKFRPLPGRTNIILSRAKINEIKTNEKDTFACSSFDDLNILLNKLNSSDQLKEVFFIGGADIYSTAQSIYPIDNYYLTQIFENYKCDTFFPVINFDDYQLTDSSIHIDRGLSYRFQTYTKIQPLINTQNEEENQYLALLNEVLKKGQYRTDRTKIGTLSLFEGKQLIFDIKKNFPLLTTKKVFFRGISEELLFFFSGLTNVKILQDKNIHIWDGNSSREYLDSIGQFDREIGDLGKFYGFQWKHWGAKYVNCHHDYSGKGFDQIQMIVDLIKNAPTSRRIIITAWNPGDLREMALPPCHILYQFYVDTENKTLSCSMYQRSADLFLGLPFNLSSTALFTYLLAKTCNLSPSKIIITLGDSHIYVNHIPQIIEQLSREPKPFPKLNIKNKKNKLEDYKYEDFELTEYNPHGKILAKMAV